MFGHTVRIHVNYCRHADHILLRISIFVRMPSQPPWPSIGISWRDRKKERDAFSSCRTQCVRKCIESSIRGISLSRCVCRCGLPFCLRCSSHFLTFASRWTPCGAFTAHGEGSPTSLQCSLVGWAAAQKSQPLLGSWRRGPAPRWLSIGCLRSVLLCPLKPVRVHVPALCDEHGFGQQLPKTATMSRAGRCAALVKNA